MTVVVFGGTGFLGGRVVRHVIGHDPRCELRRDIQIWQKIFAAEKSNVDSVRANLQAMQPFSRWGSAGVHVRPGTAG